MGRAERIAATISRAFAPLIDLVFPPRCPLCGAATASQNGLCAPCWGRLVIPDGPACAMCSRPMPPGSSNDMVLCAPCLADRPRHNGIAYATVYNDASRQLVLAFKHGKRIALAGQLGRLMAAKLPSVDGQEPVLVPVPLHRWRLWQRGFNQAALLAIEIQRHDKGTVLVDALVRHKATPMLGGMKRNEREHTMKGAVRVNQKREQAIKGRDVILVDDVLTSGATTNACVAALKRAGAKTVSISCFARVLDETLHGENSAYYAAQPMRSNDQNITPEAKKAPGAT